MDEPEIPKVFKMAREAKDADDAVMMLLMAARCSKFDVPEIIYGYAAAFLPHESGYKYYERITEFAIECFKEMWEESRKPENQDEGDQS